MGRDAHILRVALGRGCDEPPAWNDPIIREQFGREDNGLFRGIDANNQVTYNQLFDEKGRPVDRDKKRREGERVAAQNSIAILVSRELQRTAALRFQPHGDAEPPPITEEAGSASHLGAYSQLKSRLNLYEYTAMLKDFSTACLYSLRMRLLVFESDGSTSFVEAVKGDLIAVGIWNFLAGGIPSRSMALLLQDTRMPWNRSMPGAAALALWRELIINGLISFLRLTAELQTLHLLPASTLRTPFPLFGCFRGLTLPESLATFATSVLPSFALLYYRTEITGGIIDAFRERLVFERGSASVNSPQIVEPLEVQGHNEAQPHIQIERSVIATRHYASQDPLMPQETLSSRYWRPWGLVRSRNIYHKAGSTFFTTITRIFGLPGDIILRRKWLASSFMDGTVRHTPNWPILVSVAYSTDFFASVIVTPLHSIMTRLMVRTLLSGPFPLGIFHRETILGSLRPDFPDLEALGGEVGLRSAGGFATKIAMSFLLEAGVLVAMVGLESAIAMWYAKRQKEIRTAARPHTSTLDGT